MNCPKCGHSCENEAEVCAQCGTALIVNETPDNAPDATPEHPVTEATVPVDAPATQTAGVTLPPAKKAAPWVKPTTVFSIVIVLACLSFWLYRLVFPPLAPLGKLVPESAIAAVTIDAPWWWANLEPVRKDQETQQALKKFEEKAGISVEHDILPWLGQTGMVVFDAEKNNPHGLLVIEIRDRIALLKKLPELQKKFSSRAKTTWTNSSYAGIPLKRADVDIDGKKTPVAMGQVGGWLVCGFGGGSIEKCIDAWRGKTPSLATNADFTRLQKRVATAPRVFFCASGKGIVAMAKTQPQFSAAQLQASGVEDLSFVGAMTEKHTGFRLETYAIAKTDEARQYLRDYREIQPGLKGEALRQLPKGAVMAVSISNPGKFLEMAKKQALDAETNPQARSQMNMGFEQMRPMQEALDNISGEFAIAMLWDDKKGMGVEMIGDAGTAAKSAQSAEKLTGFFRNTGMPVEKRGQWNVIDMPFTPKLFPLAVSWGHQKEWFAMGSHYDWMNRTEKCAITLPGEAQGANTVVYVDFGFLPTLIKKSGNANSESADLVKYGLDTITLLGYGKIDASCRYSHSMVEIQGWDWKKTVETIATSPKRKNAGKQTKK